LSAVARAWQVLYLSARDADEGGAEVQTSHFWRHAKDLFGTSVPEEGRRALADLVYPVEVRSGDTPSPSCPRTCRCVRRSSSRPPPTAAHLPHGARRGRCAGVHVLLQSLHP
jgi:hypothetical protein